MHRSAILNIPSPQSTPYQHELTLLLLLIEEHFNWCFHNKRIESRAIFEKREGGWWVEHHAHVYPLESVFLIHVNALQLRNGKTQLIQLNFGMHPSRERVNNSIWSADHHWLISICRRAFFFTLIAHFKFTWRAAADKREWTVASCSQSRYFSRRGMIGGWNQTRKNQQNFCYANCSLL